MILREDFKKSFLFCPTYRTREEGGLPNIDWSFIDSFLTDEEIMVVKWHPVTTIMPDLSIYDHIRCVSAINQTLPYVVDCDVLITDYSTVMFDAHVLKKPVVLFEKDWDRYSKARGMSMEYPVMYSSYHCRTEKELLNMIRTAKRTEHDEYIRKYVCGACDGHSTQRVVDLINKMVGGIEK